MISAEYAVKLLPYQQPPTPAGQALLEAAAPPRRLVAPDVMEPATPPVPVAERLAALRAAVMGAPAWTPPPRAAPRPSLSPAEQDRLLAEAGLKSPLERERVLATEEAPA